LPWEAEALRGPPSRIKEKVLVLLRYRYFGGTKVPPFPNHKVSAMYVVVRQDIDQALKEFKRKLGRDGILMEIRRREASPGRGERRREKARLANQRRLKREKPREWRGNGRSI